MSLTLNASSGQFTADLSNFTNETGITFDHDGDSGDGSDGTTAALPVMSISDEGQKVYIAAQQLATGMKVFLLNPTNPDDLSAGFSTLNLTLSGLETPLLEIQGSTANIMNALSIIGLKGTEAGTVKVSAKGRDFKSETESKSFDVDFGIGTPSKPEVSSDILNGVSQAELQKGFNVKYQIENTGVKVGDQAKLYVSFNDNAPIILKTTVLKASDIAAGFVEFRITPLISPEGSYQFRSQFK